MDDDEFVQLHQAANSGDRAALEALWKLVYNDLREIAHRQLARVKVDDLNEDDLVAEVFLHFVDQGPFTFQSRAQFYDVSARIMRRILIERFFLRRDRKISRGLRYEFWEMIQGAV